MNVYINCSIKKYSRGGNNIQKMLYLPNTNFIRKERLIKRHCFYCKSRKHLLLFVSVNNFSISLKMRLLNGTKDTIKVTYDSSTSYLWKEVKSLRGGSRRGLHFPEVDIYYAGEILLEKDSNTVLRKKSEQFFQEIANNITSVIDKTGRWPEYPKINLLTNTGYITIEWQKIGQTEMDDYLRYGPVEWKKWRKDSIISSTQYLNSQEFQEFLQRTECVNNFLKSELFNVEFKQFIIKNLIKDEK